MNVIAVEGNSKRDILVYSLSTCGWCAKAKAWLDQNVGSYDLVYVDKLQGQEQTDIMNKLQQKVGRVAFPMIFFGDQVVVGYQPEEYHRMVEKKQG